MKAFIERLDLIVNKILFALFLPKSIPSRREDPKGLRPLGRLLTKRQQAQSIRFESLQCVANFRATLVVLVVILLVTPMLFLSLSHITDIALWLATSCKRPGGG